MSETASLTDAARLAAGRSLTVAVQRVARAWVVDDMPETRLDTRDAAVRRGAVLRATQILAGCARLALIAAASLLFLLAGPFLPPGSSVVDAERQLPVAIPGKRVALVIGNSNYLSTPRLGNPRNDAADMTATLTRLGFQVIEGFDLDKAAFDMKVREFAAVLKGAELAVFFYAGHGLQVSGRNYLVPVDAKVTTLSALDVEMVNLDLVHRIMEREAQTSVLFFDACRDNPLARNLARAMGARSTEVGPGLAAVEGGIGTLISFSTQPGNVALDGRGRNSPFAGALVRHLAASRDDLSAILIAVRNDVVKETARRQVPWEHSALTGRVYFRPPAETAAVHLRLSEVAEAWSATKDTSNNAVLDAFVTRYADSFYAELARARMDELKMRTASATASPP
jgi:uncharacterized caspase-like protein